jgi:hypothetical protein
MLARAPITLDDIQFLRGRRGVQPAEVVESELRKAILLLGTSTDTALYRAWMNLMSESANLTSGFRPDAVWMDGDTRDARMVCKDGYPANARRGLFGLTSAEFALYHVANTTTDIHNMYANAAAFMSMVSERFRFNPGSAERVREFHDIVVKETSRSDTVRGFLFRMEPAAI